jgi:hypothetical protein
MSYATHIHVTLIAAMHIIFKHIGCTLFTCDMYMCRLRHINESVLSSLKMEGIRLLLLVPCASSYSVYYYLSSPTPSATRAITHTITNAFQGQHCEKQRTEF